MVKRKKQLTSDSQTYVAPSSSPDLADAPLSIRMYCQGLGDCFLLTFRSAQPHVHVLIDCGVLLGTKDARARMNQVVDDVIRTTGGKVDLLVVTHEHWDHVSGFIQAKESFETNTLTFKNIWLAWTEKPGHPLADKLRSDRRRRMTRINVALQSLEMRLDNVPSEVETTRKVLEFFALDSVARGRTANSSPRTGYGATAAAMDWLRGQASHFCTPGEILPLSDATPGVSIYVLGPPQDETLLKKDAPRRGSDEAYELHADRASLLGAFEALASDDSDAMAQSHPKTQAAGSRGPFEPQFSVSLAQARRDPFFRQLYGFPDDPLCQEDSSWQRIDYDWMCGLSRLALKLDSDTNNTSLALAFELPDGRTLIFPGDAQIGNWLSWKDCKFIDNQSGVVVQSKDLLARAVFYKAGHHGSHNATLRVGGLEEMTSEELVAMIPVDEDIAKQQCPPTGWKMPFQPLYKRLHVLTGGRVLRADESETTLDARIQNTATDPAHPLQQFRKRVRYSADKFDADNAPLYIEYFLPAK